MKKTQHFEILKLDGESSAKLKAQDSRGLFKKDEKVPYGRLHLKELASRVPNALAALSGGNFHYTSPPGKKYEWNGAPYKPGDPLGEVVIEGKIISQNPAYDLWGAARIDREGNLEIVDTNSHPNIDEKTQFSIGAVPILIKNGKVLTSEELGPSLHLPPNQSPTPGIQFRTHMKEPHARAGICKTEKDDTLLIMVEGKQQRAVGLRMTEFAKFLKKLGCKNALNLDGGGTADIITADGQGSFKTNIASSDPSGKRTVANAFVITK